jgi:uncharacterized protein YjbI with pentapeptide repeats
MEKAQMLDGAFVGTHLKNVNFKDAILKGSHFQESSLEDIDFINTDLRSVNFKSSTLKNIKDVETKFYGKKPWGGVSSENHPLDEYNSEGVD